MKRMMVAGVAVAAVLALSACGGGAAGRTPTSTSAATPTSTPSPLPSAEALLEKANADARNAQSVRLLVVGTRNGQRAEAELAGRMDGSNQSVRHTVGDGVLRILTVDGFEYTQANEEYMKAEDTPPEKIARLRGKWIKSPGVELAAELNPQQLLQPEHLPIILTEKPNIKVTAEDLAGVPAYKISDASVPSKAVWVSADDKNRFLRIAGVEGEEVIWFGDPNTPFVMDLSDWDAVEPVSAPPASDIAK